MSTVKSRLTASAALSDLICSMRVLILRAYGIYLLITVLAARIGRRGTHFNSRLAVEMHVVSSHVTYSLSS